MKSGRVPMVLFENRSIGNSDRSGVKHTLLFEYKLQARGIPVPPTDVYGHMFVRLLMTWLWSLVKKIKYKHVLIIYLYYYFISNTIKLSVVL